jgi:hypothetical protein
MNMTDWQHSTPPAPGDYRATYAEAPSLYRMLRHWSGIAWSAPWCADDPEHIADRARRTPGEQQDGIVWRAAR